jgi:ATP-binding protein involved in chromosome partitioning
MTTATIIDLLGTVTDPEFDDDIVSLGFVNEVTVEDDTVHVSLALGAPYSPAESALADEVRDVLSEAGYEPSISAAIPDEYSEYVDLLPRVENIIAVGSGKGGVGKSTIAVNLATSIAERGARVGLFDSDVYGPNVPRMLGIDDKPAHTKDEETLLPLKRHGIKAMSLGMLVDENDPVVWRGPMVDKVLTQLWRDTAWGKLDYLIIDLPPGTGDAQLTMLQKLPVTGGVIVTSPQDVAVDDARKGLRMFKEHDSHVLGLVENMSGFVCSECETAHDVFAHSDSGQDLSQEFDVPLLGSIPLDPTVRTAEPSEGPPLSDASDRIRSEFDALTDATLDRVGARRRRPIAAAERGSPADEDDARRATH